MIHQGNFTFAGVNSQNYGVYLKGTGTFNAAARRFETVTIPGRNGTLTLDNGAFEEVLHSYEAIIPDNFAANVQGLRNKLMIPKGYARLTDSYHTDEFYLARYMRGLEPDVLPLAVGGSFTIEFTRDPRRFLLTGEEVTTLTASGSITNPTDFTAQPLLRVYGTGEFTVGTGTMTITAADSYTDIDCEIQEAFKGTTSRNLFISGDFPTLEPGANTVTLGSGITKIEITPRWFRL